jgi:DNA-directed RNA polymerase subunit RPC12/RpoP
MPGEGTYFCVICGWQVALRETDGLADCDQCGGSHFRRDSIFSSLQDHGSPTLEFAIASEREAPRWLDEAREGLDQPGYHLALRERGEILTFHLEPGWSRIGRCPTAAICLDDPSVSRRHAIVAIDEGKRPRILDDRSLNGVLVNGKRTDYAELKQGDELTIGRYHLYLLQA